MEFISAPNSIPLTFRVQDLYQKPEFDPWVGLAAASFETKLPVPPSCKPFRSEGFFRLPRHSRSICYSPAGHEPIRNVICIKGMEPFAPDFTSRLDSLLAIRSPESGLNGLEHFILVEDKLPLCVLFGEAEAEASIAAMVQARLSEDGEGIPRLPLPATCIRLPDAAAQIAAREISIRTPRLLRDKVEKLAASGLGAYVYWYPSVPLRARSFSGDRKIAVAMAEGWMNLAARLLRAGFLPTTAHSLGRGHCCNPQNSVIDGGFADLGSVVPVSDLAGRQDVFIALQITIRRIAEAILWVLGQDIPRRGDFAYNVDWVRDIVRERLARSCDRYSDPGLTQFFGAVETVEAVAELLN